MKNFDIANLTHEQIRQHIGERPAVIVPLGGCEPFGDVGVMGIETECAAGIAKELSNRAGILSAPVIPIGCSTPFTAFHGAAGIKPRTFVNMLGDIMRSYVCQGITKIILISAAPFNREPAEEAVKRLTEKYPKTTALFFDINTILCDDQQLKDKDRVDRNDELLLSLHTYLRHNQPLDLDLTNNKKFLDKNSQYRIWKKRGMDPQKFRKLCPDGLLLLSDAVISYEKGRDYLERILGMIQEKAKR